MKLRRWNLPTIKLIHDEINTGPCPSLYTSRGSRKFRRKQFRRGQFRRTIVSPRDSSAAEIFTVGQFLTSGSSKANLTVYSPQFLLTGYSNPAEQLLAILTSPGHSAPSFSKWTPSLKYVFSMLQMIFSKTIYSFCTYFFSFWLRRLFDFFALAGQKNKLKYKLGNFFTSGST